MVRVVPFIAAGALVAASAALPAARAVAQTDSAARTVANPTSYRHGVTSTVVFSRPPAGATVAPATPSTKAATAATGTGNLSYGGGNGGVGVTTGVPKVYLVFWGSQWGTQSTNGAGYLTLSGDGYGEATDLQAFFKGLGTGGETWSGVMTQYCEGVAAASTTCPSAAAHVGYPSGGALAGVWADTGTAAPASPTGHQLAVEAVNAANHFGNATQASNRNAQYFVVSPTGTTPDGFNTPGSTFCAWHDVSADSALPGGGAANSSIAVAFTNMPYLPDVVGRCGENFVNIGGPGLVDGVTIVGGHEYAETLTDQFPPGGWLDSSGNENGDKCAWIPSGQGAAQDITLSTGTFAVQSTWANDFNGGAGGCEVSHPVVGASPSPAAPSVTSAPATTFVGGTPATFTVTTTGNPAPSLTEAGALPAGITFTDNHNGTAALGGTAATTVSGDYPITITASNGVGASAGEVFTVTVEQAPVFTSAPDEVPMVEGVAAKFCLGVTGSPVPTVTETGALPAGIVFSPATVCVSGTPAVGSTGTYTPTFAATNPAGMSLWTVLIRVTATALTYPAAGQANVDTTKPFTWSNYPYPLGYQLVVGSTPGGGDLFSSGALPSTQNSVAVPTLPPGKTLYATLSVQQGTSWLVWQQISFTATPVLAAFTYPVNGQTGADPTKALTWTANWQAQGYIVVVGTTRFGTNLANSGILPASQTSYTAPILPANQQLYATLLTKVNGTWSLFQAISFTTGSRGATFTNPINGQLNVAAPLTVTWSTVAAAQAYYLVIGTTLYGSDIANSNLLPPSRSSLEVGWLPKGKLLYATLLTEVNGTWTFQVVGIGT